MPRIFVPKSNQPAIKKLLEFDQHQFDLLVASLKGLPERKGDLLRLSNVPIPTIPKDDSENVLNTVEMLYRIWSSRGNQSLRGFVDNLVEAISDFYPDADTEKAKARLTTVLEIEPLASASKALAVSTTHERVFYDAKILTDIRYAFRPDPEAEPYGATIIHVLEIVYHEHGDHKSVFVALDGPDLSIVKEVIERAEKKSRRLRRDLEKASVRFLGKNGQ